MKHNLFILYGAANTGKTTTFNELLKSACDQFLDKLVYFERSENCADFLAVFQNKNVKVGLYSSGDNEWHVSHNLYGLHHQGCNFIFGTSRTQGGSCQAVNNYADLFYSGDDSIKWHKKESATDRDNNKMAKELFSTLKKLLVE
ncbi:hypothetical protein [Aggregatibacter actinomycetemcomitans]|uniref:hypothetical protein n=1 Tax=Aggregatibacter actinomycetemcomitans TaxID=714 RepID=UPI001E4C7D3C|nr:hypothetical protein [Aggregatibacter actinomycetemcomitans]